MAALECDRNGKCAFFVDKKRRFCKMVVAKGHRFCGEHANMDTNVYEEGCCRRIVCPLDPKHTVSKDNLYKHLRKCNSRDKAKPVYYVENINAGSVDNTEHSLQETTLCERSATQLQHLLDKLDSASKGLPCEPEELFMSHGVLQEVIDNPKNGDSACKHLKQQSSILGHLEVLGLLRRGRCFVEFGAGRGKLSHWILRALEGDRQEHLQILLVERSSTRFKVDGKHREGDVEFARLQIDIQHLDLSQIPLPKHGLPLVAVGKHLCGAATAMFPFRPGSPLSLPKTVGAGSRPALEMRPGDERSQWGCGPGAGAVLPPPLRVASLRGTALLLRSGFGARRIFGILPHVQLGHMQLTSIVSDGGSSARVAVAG
ncbi:tRNA:m(4)X modification enzyme TRM13 homolog isoform X3 [Syngnathus typhle]|uniref:tRNA:m(4)X modification enzyme TRM13 homolog isoform X3 n=1 Tax=Syngnathus typhle TaxID=161592 RepID=UPI002A6B6E7B|nr:tRNA:m(4)X modification enzyme TRM13 homolog isoform X3 [Syngnathus typhle]